MTTDNLPLVTFLLLCYNQQNYIAEALAGALAQDYGNLEIMIADDASQDDTVNTINAVLEDYTGRHRIKRLFNQRNLGIGGNIDQAVRQSNGQLIFIAGGDDVSLPHRVSRVVEFWLAENKRPDLIGAYLFDMDQSGGMHGTIQIAHLELYRTLDDWSRSPPHVIGAAQAWSRRLFDRFDGLPRHVVGEDMVMAFRAIGTSSAYTLAEPLVKYRRGGLTSKRKALTAADVVRGLTKKLVSTRVELKCMQKDASLLGASPFTMQTLEHKLAKEDFIAAMFSASSLVRKMQCCFQFPQVSAEYRLRILTYASAPWLLAPFFYFKRLRYQHRLNNDRIEL